jgi:endogenous inhibitor of DNA gyrase (YacG/DUF329 family)
MSENYSYLVKVQCSVCTSNTTFVREFSQKIPFGTDIGPNAEYCPKCQNQTEWDLLEEAKIERVNLE